MKRSRMLAILPAALLLFVAAGRHRDSAFRSVTQEAGVAQSPSMIGTFLFTAQGSDNVEEVIKAGTARMNFIKRPIARSRLKKTNQPYQSLTMGHTPAQVSVQTDSRKPILTPADGKSIKWTREDGEVFDVNTVWEGAKLKQTFVADDGLRENLFWLSPDGNTLTMQVTIRSPQLPAPIVYKVDYRRKA
jgi:hypothetical protein